MAGFGKIAAVPDNAIQPEPGLTPPVSQHLAEVDRRAL